MDSRRKRSPLPAKGRTGHLVVPASAVSDVHRLFCVFLAADESRYLPIIWRDASPFGSVLVDQRRLRLHV